MADVYMEKSSSSLLEAAVPAVVPTSISETNSVLSNESSRITAQPPAQQQRQQPQPLQKMIDAKQQPRGHAEQKGYCSGQYSFMNAEDTVI